MAAFIAEVVYRERNGGVVAGFENAILKNVNTEILVKQGASIDDQALRTG